jgi:2-iminoacetate synthase
MMDSLIFSSFASLHEGLFRSGATDIEKALGASHPGGKELAALLSPAAGEYLAKMAEKAGLITKQRFGRTIQIYAPLYLSSYCSNRCLYCGFSADNEIERRVLTIEEAEHEADILAERGFNHILLVSGEAPARLGVEYLEVLARRLRNRFASVSIEVQPLSVGEYTRLFAAGITAVAVYQETYDQSTYAAVHSAGKKRDYDYRLDTPVRAAMAGMREVGIGALLGLSEWRAEGLALGLHLAWLRKKFWRTAFTVSFPRLRPAEGEFSPTYPVGERELAQMIFALRIFDPDVGLVLSTREEPRFRDGMIGLGPTRYSAGSCTVPGGYGNCAATGEQFSVGDHRSVDEVCASIRDRGYDPVRKDWDSSFQDRDTAQQAA